MRLVASQVIRRLLKMQHASRKTEHEQECKYKSLEDASGYLRNPVLCCVPLRGQGQIWQQSHPPLHKQRPTTDKSKGKDASGYDKPKNVDALKYGARPPIVLKHDLR